MPVRGLRQWTRRLSLSPVSIAGLYVVVGGLWIAFSDPLAASLAPDPGTLTTIQTVKGWLFVGVSGVLIYGLVHVHSDEFENQETRLRRRTQQLQVFARVLRHNVRNELTVILGRARLADDQAAPEDDDLREQIDRIEASSERLLHVSEKVRRINRIDFTEDPEPKNLVGIIRSVLDHLETDYSEVTIRTDLPEVVYIETNDSIAIAIHELAENAVEHNDLPPEDRLVAVTADYDLAGTVTVEIADNGPGIETGEVEPIVRGEETPLEHGSSIGLWLARWVTDDHDGDLTLTANDDGTTATIDLPLDTVAQARAGAAASLR